MSSLRSVDLNSVANLVDFYRGTGYVLDFSDSTFSSFFVSELDVDIDDARYKDMGSSKGKRLRRFLQLVDDPTALKTMRALWERRAMLVNGPGQQPDPVSSAEVRYLAIVNRLNGQPGARSPQEPPKLVYDLARTNAMMEELRGLWNLEPHPRGYAFEAYLNNLFEMYGLKPREPFRNVGEQIDGSFMLANATYLLEAKWHKEPTGAADLHVFEGKLGQKANWARGLFVSYGGFTDEGLYAFGVGKRTICMEGRDIYQMLERRIPFDEVIERKARRAVETGKPFIPMHELF